MTGHAGLTACQDSTSHRSHRAVLIDLKFLKASFGGIGMKPLQRRHNMRVLTLLIHAGGMGVCCFPTLREKEPHR
jgi:hypothetical protein